MARRKFNVGDKFKLTPDAVDNYGAQYADRVFVVCQWFDHYLPAKDMTTGNDPHGHPGYDGSSGERLYEAGDLSFAVYEWEMERA